MEKRSEKTFSIPQIYLPPVGGPLYWRNEQSGVLPAAVWAYLNHCATDSQLKLLSEYLEYYIHAPCWDLPGGFLGELEELRQSSKTMRTEKEIHDWIFKALNVGIDPL